MYRLKAASSQGSYNAVFKHIALCKTTKTPNKCHLIHPTPMYATPVRMAKLSYVVLLYQIVKSSMLSTTTHRLSIVILATI